MLSSDQSSEMSVVSISEESGHSESEDEPLLGSGSLQDRTDVPVFARVDERRLLELIQSLREVQQEENNTNQRDVENLLEPDDLQNTLRNQLRNQHVPFIGNCVCY